MNELIGKTGTDVLTGFTGLITGYTEYISGCNQLLLAPKAKDGKYVEPMWFDVQRVEIDPLVDKVSLDNEETPGPDKEAPKR